MGLALSFIFGGLVGIVMMSLIFAASQSDDQLLKEEQYKETK